MDDTEKGLSPKNPYLWIHRSTVFFMYVLATAGSYRILVVPAAHSSFIVALSSAAILATFGSAIATIGSLWTGDYGNRITLNVDILFRNIFKQKPWRRWPFLLRGGKKKLFGGDVQSIQLQNPKIKLYVGSHDIEITIPTVQDDFFDLPLFKNLVPLLRFRTAENTTVVNAPKEAVFQQNKLKPMDQYMAYECLTDIWWSVFVFRFARYVVHFGAALTISSAVLGGAAALANAV